MKLLAALALALAVAFAPAARADDDSFALPKDRPTAVAPAPAPAPPMPNGKIENKKLVKVYLVPVIYGRTDGNLLRAFKQSESDVVLIKDGYGGEVVGMYKTIAYLRQHPEKKIVIDGQCNSACTYLLAKDLPNACFTKNAVFGFHSAASQYKDGKKKIDATARKFNQMELDAYDDALKAWIMERDALGTIELTELGADEAQELTHKMCKGNEIPSE